MADIREPGSPVDLPGGRRVEECGVCPAAVEERLDGVLGGVNAGRSCWMVVGAFCRGVATKPYHIHNYGGPRELD